MTKEQRAKKDELDKGRVEEALQKLAEAEKLATQATNLLELAGVKLCSVFQTAYEIEQDATRGVQVFSGIKRLAYLTDEKPRNPLNIWGEPAKHQLCITRGKLCFFQLGDPTTKLTNYIYR